jgi:hypothetical protein
MRPHAYRVAPILCFLALAAALLFQWTAKASMEPDRAQKLAAELARQPPPPPEAADQPEFEDKRLLTVGEYRRLEQEEHLRDIQERQDWAFAQNQYQNQQLRRLEEGRP